jgi:hypothetical protein
MFNAFLKNTFNPEALKKKMLSMYTEALNQTGIEFVQGVNAGGLSIIGQPPIDRGDLRGNSHVYNGSIPIFSMDPSFSPPSYNGKENVITVVWDQPYAVYMHQLDWNPGPRSAVENGVNFYVSRHLLPFSFFEKVADKMKKTLG